MIQPTNLTANADPRGGRILIAWTNPTVTGFAGTRVLRRALAYPVIPDDIGTPREIYNDTATPAGRQARFLDAGLKGETVYYYAVVSYDVSAQTYTAFTSALSTASYRTGAYLYQNLPGIYQSYDTALPPPSPNLDPADLSKGQLLRLLEMFGMEFDVLRSYAGAMRSFFDASKIDGALLPLLASWIGWHTDYARTLPQQRNQVRYAPHYFATTGIAANLRATINRITTWDARIKELSHNIFLSNLSEQLTLWEQERQGSQWQSEQLVTLDFAYEGRPSALQGPDSRMWLFYHARQAAPSAASGARTASAADRFHLWFKVFDQGAWQPAHRITETVPIAGVSNTNRTPAAVLRSDGTFLVFWSSVDASSGSSMLRLQRLAAGRAALSARIDGTIAGPFALADGDQLQIGIGVAPGLLRRITFRGEAFANIAAATTQEVARLLQRELPGVDASEVPGGTLLLVSQAAGSASVLTVPASTGAAKLGLSSPPPGANAVAARLLGSVAAPIALLDGDTLLVTIDKDVPRLITFHAADFLNLAAATADEVVAAINTVVPGAAQNSAGLIAIVSSLPGVDSMVAIDVGISTAAAKLGFGAPPPLAPAGIDEAEPTALRDASGNLWLFWSSRRDGAWKIWYNVLTATGWATPRPLTTGTLASREPAALLDPSAGGRLWVFWSRKKANGLWNVFSRTTTVLDFNSQTDASWTEAEFAPPPANFDNREPFPVLVSPGNLEVYFTSNRSNGWNVWLRPVTAAVQGADAAVTSGQFTRRTPVPILNASGRVHLWFRGNKTIEYTSSLYPSARTIDGRYTGSSTADTRNPIRLSLRGNIQDIQHYTYEAPLADPRQEAARLYSRDTIAVYLTPDTDDEELILASQTLIGNVLQNFLPIQTRVVFRIDQVYAEYVYTYDAPSGTPTIVIGEEMTEVLGAVAPLFAAAKPRRSRTDRLQAVPAAPPAAAAYHVDEAP